MGNEFPIIVQIVSQLGAVGLLVLLVWQLPRLWAKYEESRTQERAEREKEREMDRQLYRDLVVVFRDATREDRVGFDSRSNKVVEAIEGQTNHLSGELKELRDSIVIACNYPSHAQKR